MTIEVRFRASCCGRYVCSVVGDSVRVLTITEADALAKVYLDHATAFTANGELALAAHEATMGRHLASAVVDAERMRIGMSVKP